MAIPEDDVSYDTVPHAPTETTIIIIVVVVGFLVVAAGITYILHLPQYRQETRGDGENIEMNPVKH